MQKQFWYTYLFVISCDKAQLRVFDNDPMLNKWNTTFVYSCDRSTNHNKGGSSSERTRTVR